MESIKVRQHIGQDGILHLNVPLGLADQEVEVLLVYQPIQPLTPVKQFPKSLYGICADDPMIIDDLGVSEALDDDLTGAFD